MLPYTIALPKPLMPVGEFPILEVIVRQLVQHGFDHITMAVNHQAELIRAFFQDGERWDIKIDYSLEDKPLSTIAPLRLIKDLPEHFMVMNGDVLSDLNYSEFFDSHVCDNHIFTISAYVREQTVDYGVLELGPFNYLSGFREKPTSEYLVSMGVYMASRRIMDFIPEGKSYGFDDLMLDLLSAGRPASVSTFDGHWLDIGRPDDYVAAIELFDSNRDVFLKDRNHE